jgi:hypothetical protein
MCEFPFECLGCGGGVRGWATKASGENANRHERARARWELGRPLLGATYDDTKGRCRARTSLTCRPPHSRAAAAAAAAVARTTRQLKQPPHAAEAAAVRAADCSW